MQMKWFVGILVGLSTTASFAQSATDTLQTSVAMTVANDTTGKPVNRTAAVTATTNATSSSGALSSITISDNGTQKGSCTATPCSIVITWTIGTTPHNVSATATFANEVHSAAIQYPN